MIKNIGSFTYDTFILDYESLERADQLKKRFLLLTFVFLIFHHVFSAFIVFNSNSLQGVVEVLCVFCGILGLVFLKRTPNFIFPTFLISIYGFLGICVGVWQNGGFFSSEISWLIVIIFSVAGVLNRKVGIVLYFCSFGFVLLMGSLQFTDRIDFSVRTLSNGLTYSFITCCSLFIIVGFIVIFIFNDAALNQIWKKNTTAQIFTLETELEKKLLQEKASAQNFTKQLLENIENDRKRIANDLHDSVNHELLVLKRSLKDDTSDSSQKIDTIINNIRQISRNLHPVMFDETGLVLNIETLVQRTQEQNDFVINTSLVYNGSLPVVSELQLYRIIQEAISNILKHAHAHAALITLNETPDEVMLEIKDNGTGFDTASVLNGNKAFGIHSIIERSKVIEAKTLITSTNKGTIILITIPKKNESYTS